MEGYLNFVSNMKLDEEDKKAASDAGMNAHLGKPIILGDMYEVLARYITKNSNLNGK